MASTDLETFIQGPKVAGARAVLALPSTFIACADAIPPFRIPTSKATIRRDCPTPPATTAEGTLPVSGYQDRLVVGVDPGLFR